MEQKLSCFPHRRKLFLFKILVNTATNIRKQLQRNKEMQLETWFSGLALPWKADYASGWFSCFQREFTLFGSWSFSSADWANGRKCVSGWGNQLRVLRASNWILPASSRFCPSAPRSPSLRSIQKPFWHQFENISFLLLQVPCPIPCFPFHGLSYTISTNERARLCWGIQDRRLLFPAAP